MPEKVQNYKKTQTKRPKGKETRILKTEIQTSKFTKVHNTTSDRGKHCESQPEAGQKRTEVTIEPGGGQDFRICIYFG